MDAKWPFTAPIQTQHPPPGAMYDMVHCCQLRPRCGAGGGGSTPSPLPTVLSSILRCPHLLHGFRELERVGCGGVVSYCEGQSLC